MDNKIKFLGILALGLIIILIALLLQVQKPKIEEPEIEEVKKFNTLNEIKDFLKENVGYGRYGGELFVTSGVEKSAETARAEDYSTTNIQVQGVDEADIVKNDGKYIYVVSGKKVVIVDAYPAENMKILGEINVNKTVSEIFVNNDKLIIFSSGYSPIAYETKCIGVKCGISPERAYNSFVYIYNIEDREKPELKDEMAIEGYYFDSRMINDYVYVLSTKYVNVEEPEPPVYIMNGQETKIKADEIYYFDYPDRSYVFTNIMAIDLDNENIETKVFLTGATHTIYVSQDNIYLSYQKTIPYTDYLERMVEEVYLPLLPDKLDDKVKDIIDSNKQVWEKIQDIQEIVYEYSNSLTGKEKEEFDKELMEKLQNFDIEIQKETEKTVVHKINIDKLDINYKGVGEVPGRILNQFSMDEFDGNFRIATTTGHVSRSGESSSLNHLYVLDENLKIIGKVENLAKGERIYSVRFLGEKSYIVTFKKVDPLFVIDLSEPENPKVLGYLKITGYSDYLHPYDENHVIGIGKETRGGGEHFSWYQGIKISLFDVSDVENPVELGKIEIGDRGTDSYALYEHKAFLFDKKRNLLVIPVLLAEIDESRYEGEIPDNTYGEYVWQGAYVLDINLEGISLRGKITHSENKTEETRYWWNDKNAVQRSLYMDNVLYTLSSGKIKANDLESLAEIKAVILPYKETGYGYAETVKAI